MTRLLSILLLLVMTGRVCADITTGLVSRWAFDEGTGTNSADSVSGNSGTLTNGPTWTTAKIGASAVNCDGSNDYVAVGTPASLELDNITLAAWVKPSVVNVFQFCFGRDNGSTTRHYVLGISDTAHVYVIAVNSGGTKAEFASSSATVTSGAYHHLAMTFDSTTVIMYLDGTSVGSAALSGTLKKSTAIPICIGSQATNAGFFHGAVDDARIYSRALSSSDITQLVAFAGAGKQPYYYYLNSSLKPCTRFFLPKPTQYALAP